MVNLRRQPQHHPHRQKPLPSWLQKWSMLLALCDIPLFSEYIEDSLDGQLTNQTVRLFCQNN